MYDVLGGGPRKKKNIDVLGSGFGLNADKPKRDTRRAFTQTQKHAIWAQQNGKCANPSCRKTLDPVTTEYDHAKPWASGGKTVTQNGRALCANCHSKETHKTRLKQVDKKRKTTTSDPFFRGRDLF